MTWNSHRYRFAALLVGVLLLLSVRPGPAQEASPLLYELLNRMETLEQELRQLRGEIELLQHQRRMAADRQELLARIEALERQLYADPERTERLPEDLPEPLPQADDPTLSESLLAPVPPRPADPLLPPPPAGAREVFEQARTALRDGRYPTAIEEFRRYLNVYPENSLTPDASYWLGEAYYAQRDFDNAERTLIHFGSRYPDNDQIPEALLRLGYIYSERGDSGRARQVLERLISAYPDSVAATLGEQQLRQLR